MPTLIDIFRSTFIAILMLYIIFLIYKMDGIIIIIFLTRNFVATIHPFL